MKSVLVGKYDIDVTVKKGQKIHFVYKEDPVCKNSIEDYYKLVVSDYKESDFQKVDYYKTRIYANISLTSSRLTNFPVDAIQGIETDLDDSEAKFGPGAQIGLGISKPITEHLAVRGELNYVFENPNISWEYYFAIKSWEISPRLVYIFNNEFSAIQFYVFGGAKYNRINNITLKSDLSDHDEIFDLSENSSKNIYGLHYGIGFQTGPPTITPENKLFTFLELGYSQYPSFLIDGIGSSYKTFIAFKLGIGF